MILPQLKERQICAHTKVQGVFSYHSLWSVMVSHGERLSVTVHALSFLMAVDTQHSGMKPQLFRQHHCQVSCHKWPAAPLTSCTWQMWMKRAIVPSNIWARVDEVNVQITARDAQCLVCLACLACLAGSGVWQKTRIPTSSSKVNI